MRGIGRLLAAAMLAIAIAGCAGPRVKPVAADSAHLADQAAREHALAARPTWSVRGRLGVSDGRDSGSGSLEWSQREDAYSFSLHAPVTGKTWVLSGDDTHALLQGVRDQPLAGSNAQSLLETELGWHVPVAELAFWVRAMRAPGAARMTFRSDGLPATIEQSGWTVDYLDYDAGQSPPLPSRVFARKGNYKVRLAIQSWTFP